MNQDPGIITSIMIDENAHSPIVTSGNLRRNRTQQLGIPIYQLNMIPQIEISDYINETIHNVIDNSMMAGTITINKRVLDTPELLQAIRSNIEQSGLDVVVRISDEGYSLTREDYEKLSFSSLIVVDECEPDLEAEEKIVRQHGVFKFDAQQDVQPVVERRTSFDEIVNRNTFHITHPLTEEEFQFLAQNIEYLENAAIELDYFDPSYYDEFLTRLQNHTSKTNIHIQLIGYLLEDQIETFSRLEKYPYEIDVIYSTCHDMIDEYQKEPYTESRLYRSSIEGGGITSLGNYLNVLEEVTNFETMTQNMNLSPLEIAVFAKMRMDDTYIYDPDSESEETDAWDNVNLSQMIHHRIDGRNRGICLGFSTLYSAYLRRCNVPMFRYSTTSHNRNIGRIKDDKYGIDTICATDITWDLPDQNLGYHSYNNFMKAPRDFLRVINNNGNHELLTLADTLVLSHDTCDTYLPVANDSYESFYHPFYYDPRGYTARFLSLTGYASETEPLDFYEMVYRLNEENHLEEIPLETVERAISNVMTKLNRNEESQREYLNDVEYLNSIRDSEFSPEYALYGADYDNLELNRNYPVPVLTPEYVRTHREKLSDTEGRRLIFAPVISNQETQDELTNIEAPSEETERDIINTIDVRPQEELNDEVEEENTDYVHQLIAYCQENNISIYNYYRSIGRYHRRGSNESIPNFENTNPFLSEHDLSLLRQSDDNLMEHYFANSMMQVINLNLTIEEQRQFEHLFSRQEDTYVDALIEENNERFEERETILRETRNHQVETTQVEERNTELEDSLEHGEELIPGTNDYQPRDRAPDETDEEYESYLEQYYSSVLPNTNYINAVVQFVRDQNITLFDYYFDVANHYRHHEEDNLPALERANPFITESDIRALIENDDERIPIFFASSLAKIVEKNLSQQEIINNQPIFVDLVERYNEEVGRIL